MKQINSFHSMVLRLALPVALQTMLQSSFSLIDQLMIGQLGSVEVAAIGLAGKFSSMFSVLLGAVAAVAGIMLAQAMGAGDRQSRNRGFCLNLSLALGLAAVFTAVCLLFPGSIMSLYSRDAATVQTAAAYLRLVSLSFLPMALSSLLASLLRCMDRAGLPLYAGLAAAVGNTGLNYLLIFGKLGLPALGVEGAAVATALSQLLNMVILLVALGKCGAGLGLRWEWGRPGRAYLAILLPLLVTELLWSLGENVYGMIYGRLGTEPCAAMTLLNPIQSLVMGALSGLAQAAGILVGRQLGAGRRQEAYEQAKALLRYGLLGSAALSVLLLLLGRPYIGLYQVEPAVKSLAWQLTLVYAAVSPIKAQNMILGSGVLRSGGKTRYVMWIDIIGTWAFGVPLGLLAAFVWGLTIPWVYLLLSLEEGIRLAISLSVFRRKGWMQQISS